jgi:hypothetical protein
VFERCDALLPLRPSLRIEPNIERLGAGSTIHGEPEGMVGWYDIEEEYQSRMCDCQAGMV